MANILLVVADKTAPTLGEGWFKNTFCPANGHTATYASDEDAEVSQAGYDCAVLSDSCNFATVGTKYTTNWTKGVVVGSTGWVTRSLAGTLSNTSRDNIAINNAASPLVAGLTSPVTVFTAAQNMGFTTSIGDADPAFKLSVSASYPIFAYEAGHLLVNSAPAPGRRVGMGLKEASWQSLTADGQTVWLNAIAWAATLPNARPVVTITSPPSAVGAIPAGTKLVLEFTAPDPEDGDVTANAQVTSSNTADGTGGALGAGSPLTIDTTGWADGERTITVTATDSGELTGSAVFNLTIGAAAGGATSPYLIARAAVAPLGGF